MASIPSEGANSPLDIPGHFSDAPSAPQFRPSPWIDERFVSHSAAVYATYTGQEVLASTGRPADAIAHASDWSLEVMYDVFPPAPEGHLLDVGALARQIGQENVLPMLLGRQRWVAWRPARPYPYFEMIVGRDDQILSTDIRELPRGEITRREWDALYDGIRLLNLAVRHAAGRPAGSRNDLDHETWLTKARDLRKHVRHGNISMPGAITRLELGITPKTGWTWIEDLDQEEPETETE